MTLLCNRPTEKKFLSFWKSESHREGVHIPYPTQVQGDRKSFSQISTFLPKRQSHRGEWAMGSISSSSSSSTPVAAALATAELLAAAPWFCGATTASAAFAFLAHLLLSRALVQINYWLFLQENKTPTM
jgi:hypothetical protein